MDTYNNITITNTEKIDHNKRTGVVKSSLFDPWKFEGDPDLKSCHDRESPFIVWCMNQLATWINTVFREQIFQLYYRNDMLGGIARQVLQEPRRVYWFDSRLAANGPSRRLTKLLPPRLSLRLFAQYSTLFFLAIFFIVQWGSGYPFHMVFGFFFSFWVCVAILIDVIGMSPEPLVIIESHSE